MTVSVPSTDMTLLLSTRECMMALVLVGMQFVIVD